VSALGEYQIISSL